MKAGINYVKSTCGLEVRVRERIPRTDLMWDHACDDSNPIIKLNTRHVCWEISRGERKNNFALLT